MILNISHLSLLVKDYDEAVNFYTQKIGFVVTSDVAMPEMGPGMRWLVITPNQDCQTKISLCKATTESSITQVGHQCDGYPLFTIFTNDIEGDIQSFKTKGVEVTMEVDQVAWGKHSMIKDLYGNLIYIVEESKND
jgi:predicted enzyme related to lactoylglutathione lyase